MKGHMKGPVKGMKGIILDLLENKNVGCRRKQGFRQLFYTYLLIWTFAKTLLLPTSFFSITFYKIIIYLYTILKLKLVLS